MENVKTYIEKHQDRFINELFELIRIPSVSINRNGREDMQHAAEKTGEILLQSGADRVEVMSTSGWPVVFGEKRIREDLPTVLVYGHYDVQPAEPLEKWNSPPFEPEIRDRKIFARGADDDKGQLFMQIKAFEYMVAENKLPCNVKFLIEGEEEIGSPALKEFCRKNRELLASDVVLVSDTTMFSLDVPTVTVGLRGLAYFEIAVSGSDRDLHSGLYGGAVNNPCNVLTDIISRLKDEKGKITIPGFYDEVKQVSKEERLLLNQVPFDEKEFAGSVGLDALSGELGFSTLERLGIRPSLDVNGIRGGYTEEGAKTIIPSEAFAKVSVRLVPNQDPDTIELLLKKHLLNIAPKGVRVGIQSLHGGNAYVSPWESKEVQSAVMAIEKSFGKKPLPVRSGGSIPVIAAFEEVLGIKTVLMGFGLESDAIHSPNENFPLENFFKGIETIPWFYHFYAKSYNY